MNWINFTIFWGIGNEVLGLLFNNDLLVIFGFGILVGALCSSIVRANEEDY